jgi:hypothetical protein
MDQKAGRSSADQRVVNAGDKDPWLLAPGRTRAQRLRSAQPRSRSTAESEDILTTKSRKELTVHDIKTILKKEKIAFDSRSKKSELLGVLEQHKLQEVSKENLPQPSENSHGADTHASDHMNDGIRTVPNQIQNDGSNTPSTPRAVRTIREQVPWKHQSQTSITQREPKSQAVTIFS